MMRTITLELDDDDERAVQEALTERQLNPRGRGGVMLPDGEGSLVGRLIADICRAFCDYRDQGRAAEDETT